MLRDDSIHCAQCCTKCSL